MNGGFTPLAWWFWRVGLMESWMAPLTELGFADIVMDGSAVIRELRLVICLMDDRSLTAAGYICA